MPESSLKRPFSRQLAMVLLAFALLLGGKSFAQGMVELNIDQVHDLPTGRHPATYVPNVELQTVPAQSNVWQETIFVEDDRGVMAGMRGQLADWQRREDYITQWDVEPTPDFVTPDMEAKKRYLKRYMIRYIDKRLSGEIKHAEKGSAMHRVGKVHKALKPNATAAVTKNIKLKFKARVIQGRAYMIVDNPYVDAKTEVTMTGRIEMRVGKNFSDLGLSAHVQYNAHEDNWHAQMDQKLTDRVTARLTSHQADNQMAFTKDSNRTLQLMYSLPF